MSNGGEAAGPVSSTTISTMAVRGGAALITVTILKSGTRMQLQLAESDPNLLEIGGNVDETLRLLRDHEQLLSKLKKHDGGMWGLLEQADKATAQCAQLHGEVHKAMARTLSDAWSTLIVLLERRVELLRLASEFFACAHEFAVRIDEAEDFQRDMEEVTTMACEEAVLLKHCCIKRGLLEKSMSVMNKSQELLDVLRGFGAEPALPRSAAAQGTRTSCGRVECLMEVLQDRRRHVDERLTQRSLRLKGLLRISQWKERKQEVLQWFKDNAEVYFQKDQLGSTLTENEELLEACKDFALKARDWSSQVEKLLLEASGVTVVPDAVDAKQLAEKSLELKALRDELWRLLVARQEDLQEGHAFFSAANQAFEALAALGAELHVPRSQAVALPQLARRHEDLGRSARESVSEPLRLGRLLLQRLRPHSAQVGGVQRMLGYLQERAESLSGECHAHRELAERKRKLVSSIEDLLDKVSTWLKGTSTALCGNVELGSALSQSEDMLNKHLELSAQAQDMAGELSAAVELVTQLEELESVEAAQFSGRSGLLREELRALSRSLAERVKTLRAYVCFLRTAEEVDERMQSLQQGYRERPQDEVCEEESECRWQGLLERFLTMQDQGHGFIRSSTMVSKSLGLDVTAAVGVVEKAMAHLSKKKAALMDLWVSWQLQVSHIKSVKKQWKKFKEHLKKTVHDLEAMGEVLAPVSSADLGSDLVTVTKLQENFQRVKPHLMQLNAEVEYLVKISELFTQRGIPVKEKSEKVAELLHVHQGVKEKAKECENILGTAVRFHQVYDELENMLLSTSASPLPGTSHAHLQLTQHQERRSHAHHLYQLAITLGAEVTNAVRQAHALGFSVQRLQGRLERLQRESEGWWAEAERREENLLSNVHHCLFKEELHELRESFKELKKKFNNLKFSYVKRNEKARNLKAVKNQIQQMELYVEKLQVLQKKVQTFALKVSTSTEKQLVGGGPREMEDAVNELRRQLGDLGKALEEYKQSLERTARLQQAVDEFQFWCDELSSTIVRVGKFSSECGTKEAVAVLYRQFEKFVWPMVPQQEERIQQITEVALRLHGPEEGKKFVEKTTARHNEIVESIKELCSGLLDLEAKLPARDVKEPLKTNPCQAETPDNKPERTIMMIEGDAEESGETSELKESGHTPENMAPGYEKEAPSRQVLEQNHTLPEARWETDQLASKLHSSLSGTKTIGTSSSPTDKFRRILVLQETQGCPRTSDIQRASQENVQAKGGFQEASATTQGAVPHSANEDAASRDASELLEPTEMEADPMMCDLQHDLVTEESLSNDEYECTSPDDISLPPLSETPESNVVQLENDLDDSFCPSSHSQPAPSYGQQALGEGPPAARFRVESSSFVRSPLTVPTPGLVSSTLSSILKSKLPPAPLTALPPAPHDSLQERLYSVHESFTQTQECVHEAGPSATLPRPSNTHATPPPLTTKLDLDPGLCKPTAVREEVRLLSGSRTPPGLPGKAPSFSRLLSSATVTEGSPVTLEVEVVGSPEPTLTWYRNGRKVTSGERIDVSHKDGKHALFIRAVAEGDAGLYVARAVNASGALSSSAALQVKGKSEHELAPALQLDWLTCFGTLCFLLWLLYLLVL
ncbi:coiled-coil domain-containing protein 141 [Scleropages formosus]|uniref:Coiled-coil domain containing 141 n=1 Tax=Scleropages formosus TaxID=113540 RepID=A0A8C9RRQ2_SCLFO|nr:coiled-coil domain-containing protein 141 [Scleropages formosus]